MSNAPQLVQELWNYPPPPAVALEKSGSASRLTRLRRTSCNILRDDGLSFHLRMATTRHDGQLASHAPLVCCPGFEHGGWRLTKKLAHPVFVQANEILSVQTGG